ncbi:hypothetical protein GCM10010461_23420 [Microbacterium aurantiacum]
MMIAVRGLLSDAANLRAAARADHFMPASLLSSQLATLEPLESDEAGVEIDVNPPVDDIVRCAATWLGTRATLSN